MTKTPALAWVALAATVLIWATFLVSTRAAVTGALGPVEVGIMRYGPALILFLPVLIRHGPLPTGAGLREVLLVGLMGGLIFIMLLTSGLRFAPVADSGVFAPSMLPFFVAVLSFFLLGERFDGLRLTGFVLILIGALAVGGWDALSQAESGAWRGHLLFLAGAFCWAIYTIAFRKSSLTAMQAAAMISFWSMLGFGALALFLGVDFTTAPTNFVILQFLLQGVLSGFTATITYGYAITHLGASRTAAYAALVPVLAALGGWIFLDEPIGAVKTAGILVVSLGVALASGALTRRRMKSVP